MDQEHTPMMQQYLSIKKNYQDCLLLYRMGDFYELFLEDAHIGAQVLNITLTGKSNGKNQRIPMAGVPYHAADGYIAKLVKAGYKVAICEQISPPNKKGLVKREVIRVVTPGTMLDEKILDKKKNNFIICLDIIDKSVALSIADLSTGYFATTEISTNTPNQVIHDELSQLHPAECILSERLYNDPSILHVLNQEKQMNIYCFKEWDEYVDTARKLLEEHFGVKTLAGFGIADKKHATITASVLLGYLQQTQKTSVKHIKKIIHYERTTTMVLDKSTIINLELFSTLRDHTNEGSLLYTIDQTQTAMGGRLLKQWLIKPLLKKEEIQLRQDAVEELVKEHTKQRLLRTRLSEVNDIERLLSRLSVNIGNARDMVNLKNSLKQILDIKQCITDINSTLFKELSNNISQKINTLITYIEQTIVDEPPVEIREGGIIKKKIHNDLDELRSLIANSKTYIENLEKKERERTGINSLKIRFNQVFGFYIEVSKTNTHLVPKHYMRKQTLVNGERFITEELKKHEEIILSAEEKAHELEYRLFQESLSYILSFTEQIQQAAQAIAIADCVSNFAYISQKYQYVRPKLLYSGEIKIVQGRHPVVEQLLEIDNQFVPNDVTLDNIKQSVLLITGPNMAGKSVLIRQVALILLLNQIGCFIPAKSAQLSLVDRIFVRSGASDIITSGLSTFMVEMVETANILHQATEKSFIVMDEIGRGTSTYDGISIAWAVAEYLATHFQQPPKVLFATHYHELQALEDQYPQIIRNYHMAVAEEKGEPIFLHTLLPGGASHSFGVAVAKLAGVPMEVINNANKKLHLLENAHVKIQSTPAILKSQTEGSPQHQSKYSPQHIFVLNLLIKQLSQLDIAHITPLDALNKLAELKDHLTLIETESAKSFLEAD